MKFALATIVALLASFGAQAQGMCQQEFAACMERCGLQDRCMEGCQARNTACTDALWNKPKPSYEDFKRPSNESLAAAEEAEKAPEPAPVESKRPARPKKKRPARRQ